MPETIAIQPQTASGTVGDAEDAPLPIGRLLQSLRHYWLGILLTSAVSGGVVALSWRNQPLQYSGQFQIVLSDPNQGMSSIGTTKPAGSEGKGGAESQLSSLAALAGIAGLSGGAALDTETQLEILRSPVLLEPLYEQLRRRADAPAGLSYRSFAGMATAEIGKKTRVVTVSVVGPSSSFVQAMLEGLSRAYQDYSDRARRRSIAKGLSYIDAQLPRQQARLDGIASRLEDFQERYLFLTPEVKAQEVVTRQQQAEQTLQKTQMRLQAIRLAATELQTQVSLPRAEALVEALSAESTDTGAPQVPALAEFRKVDAELAVQSSRLKPGEPQIVSLKARRQRLVDSLLRNANVQLISLQAQEATERQTYQEMLRQARELPTIARTYVELKRQYDVTTLTLQNLLLQQEALRLDQAKKPDSWEVISKPSVAEQSEWPRRLRLLLLAMLAGAIAAAGAALLWERRRGLIRHADSLADLEVGTLLGPWSAGLVQEREQRLWLQLAEKLPQGSIGVISAQSPIALAAFERLASVWGQLGERVLLLDLGQVGTGTGFWDSAARTELDVKELLSPLADNCWYLAGGEAVTQALTLVGQARTRELLLQLEQGFDRLLVLLPPVLARSWALVLLRDLQSLMLRIHLGRDTRQDLEELLALLVQPVTVTLLVE